MASDARHQAADLTRSLLSRGERYSFFQAYRLLRLLAKQEGVTEQEAIRVRPRLGLGFPQTDLHGIEGHGHQRYRITANFLGLYGVDSPLPTFYTEDLLNEQADGYSVNREFLDIFAQSIYPLFFQAWLKARPALRVIEYADHGMLDILYSFVGIAQPKKWLLSPGVGLLLRFGSIYSQQARTAAGLQTVLKATFAPAHVEVRQLQPAWVAIPDAQRFRLGVSACALGENAHVGERCRSLDGITVALTALSAQLYRDLLPGHQAFERLKFLVDYYLIEPLPVQVELGIDPQEAMPAELSNDQWSKLGADTWIGAGQGNPVEKVSFPLPLRELQSQRSPHKRGPDVWAA